MKKYLCIGLSILFVTLIALPSTAFGFSLTDMMGGFFQFVMKMLGFKTDLSGYCWFCPITQNLFYAAGQMSQAIITKTKDMLLVLLGLGTLFFIAFKVGATVIKLQEVDLMQFMGELFKTLGRVIIAAAILGGGNFVVREIITPFLGLALNFSIELMNESHLQVSNKTFQRLSDSMDYIENAEGEISRVGTYAQQWSDTVAAGGDPGVFSPFLVQSIIALMAKASANLVVGMAVGLVLILTSMVSSFIFPDVQNVMSGTVIFFSFAALYITVPFQLINFVIQLTFVVSLLPFWVVLWAFPATAQYCQNAFKLFLQTCLCFMIFGIMLVLVMNLVGYMLPNSGGILAEMCPGYEWIAGQKANVISRGVLTTLALGYLSKELLKGSGELAARITGVYGTNIADQAAASVANVAGTTMMGGWGATLGLTHAFTGGYDKMQEAAKSRHAIKGMLGLDSSWGLFRSNGGGTSTAKTPNTYNATSNNSTMNAAKEAPTISAIYQNNNKGADDSKGTNNNNNNS